MAANLHYLCRADPDPDITYAGHTELTLTSAVQSFSSSVQAGVAIDDDDLTCTESSNSAIPQWSAELQEEALVTHVSILSRGEFTLCRHCSRNSLYARASGTIHLIHFPKRILRGFLIYLE